MAAGVFVLVIDRESEIDERKKVLILYGARFGSMQDIAKKMAEILEKKGIKVDIYDLKAKSEKEIPAFDHHDGILIGTSIKMAQWIKEVKDFVTKRKTELNSFKGPKGFFASSGYAADPEQYKKVKIEYTKDALEKVGVKIDYFDAFGGLMDFSKTLRLSWLDKKVLKSVAKNDPKIDLHGWNDLRDGKQIEDFALEFIK